MKAEMTKMNLKEPVFISEKGTFKVIFYNEKQKSEQVEKNSAQVLEYCSEPKTRKEITAYLGLKSINYVAKKIINPLIENKKLKYTNSNRRAKNQKYVTIKAREEGKWEQQFTV